MWVLRNVRMIVVRIGWSGGRGGDGRACVWNGAASSGGELCL